MMVHIQHYDIDGNMYDEESIPCQFIEVDYTYPRMTLRVILVDGKVQVSELLHNVRIQTSIDL